MRRLLMLAAAGSVVMAGPARAQEPLRRRAQAILAAWTAHDVPTILDGVRVVSLDLPGVRPAAPVSRDQAAALIRGYLAGTTERQLTLVAVRATGEERGFAELSREFRVTTGSASRSETILLGFRRGPPGWRLEEVRVVR